MGQTPSIAALALYSTDFVSVEQAVAWIYEEEEGADEGAGLKMRHPFVGCLPNTPDFTQTYLPYLDDDAMEKAIIESSLVCAICGKSRDQHREQG